MPKLDWIGKKAVVNHHRDVPFHLLKENPELSAGDPDCGNLLVQGDNLLALKALLPYFAGQVKCIYIDPPYNTGKEGWIYNDNVNSSEMREWLGKVVGKEAEDLSRHDKWLCMMYPRLSLLRQFLRDDGAIFISIDDNEVTALRMLMDEIFGKKNFVTQFIWNTEGHTDNQFHVKINHEYIVMYAAKECELKLGHVVDPNTREGSNLWAGFAENSITKNGKANPPSEVELPIGFPVKSAELNLISSETPDGLIMAMSKRGLSSNQLKAEFGKIQFPLRLDPMVAQNNKLIAPCRVYSGWANVNKLCAFIANNCQPVQDTDGLPIHFYLSENGVVYYRKERGEQARNILSVLRNMGTTEKMRSELESMGLKFSYPKPKELIKHLISIGSNDGDLVLDSFAGSGTTAQAVIELNAETSTNRQYILVEMDDNISRNITAKRISTVISGYDVFPTLGGGFRFCELGEPLFDERGNIRHTVLFPDLARHVYFTETGGPLPESADLNSPLLGVQNGTAIYLLYNGILKDKTQRGGNVLTTAILAELPRHDGSKVIYGAACRIDQERLRREGIVFKQLPYKLKVGGA